MSPKNPPGLLAKIMLITDINVTAATDCTMEIKRSRLGRFFDLRIMKIRKQIVNFAIKILERNLSFDLKNNIDPE